jgi:hypothetical protein
MKRAHAFLLFYILTVSGICAAGQNEAEATPTAEQIQGGSGAVRADAAFTRGALFNIFELIKHKAQTDAVVLLVRDMGDSNADLSGFPKGQAFLDEPLRVTIYLVFENALLAEEKKKLIRVLNLPGKALPVPLCLLMTNGAISGFASGGKECGEAILAYGDGGER